MPDLSPLCRWLRAHRLLPRSIDACGKSRRAARHIEFDRRMHRRPEDTKNLVAAVCVFAVLLALSLLWRR